MSSASNNDSSPQDPNVAPALSGEGNSSQDDIIVNGADVPMVRNPQDDDAAVVVNDNSTIPEEVSSPALLESFDSMTKRYSASHQQDEDASSNSPIRRRSSSPPPTHRLSSCSSYGSFTDSNNITKSEAASSNYSGSKKDSIWTRLAKQGDVWEADEDEMNDQRFSCTRAMKELVEEEKVSIQSKWDLLKAHPRIGIIGGLCFLAFCAASLAITFTFAKHDEDDQKNEALKMAEDLGLRFEDNLNSVTLPLFSIGEFVKELPYFAYLSNEIGPGGQVGSAPYLQGTNDTYRDVSGICDNTTTIDNFDRLAKNIKESASLSGILLQLQLAPEAVVCLMYPLNNTEDFTPPLYLDNSPVLGLDNLASPQRRDIAEKTVKSNNTIYIDGPFPVHVHECKDTSENCPIAVQNALLARLAVDVPGYNITLNDTAYPAWGFASELINGDALVDRAFQDFNSHNSQYKLSKNLNGKVIVLKASPDADKVTAFENYTAHTPNGDWLVQVGYVGGFHASWLGGAIAASILISLLLAWMLMIIFFEKHAHQDLLKEMLPRKALKKIQRGETVVEKYGMVTIFFCDIVGYNNLSADMRPIQVMKMLNTYYSEVDKLANKHKVFKIETIGDSYMCVGGAPDRCLGSEAAEHVAVFALELIELVKNFSMDDGSQILIRAGINSGPVVAGVVGTNRPQYTIFGDAVNAAARMETTSETMKIQCSEVTYRLLRDAPNYEFDLSERGTVDVKGKGRMNTWFINGGSKREALSDSHERSTGTHPDESVDGKTLATIGDVDCTIRPLNDTALADDPADGNTPVENAVLQ